MEDRAQVVPPLLIALPQGLNVSGVTMWAVRLTNALVRRGGSAGLILHAEPVGQQKLDLPIDPRVQVTDLSSLDPIQSCAGDLSLFGEPYTRAVEALAAGTGPVVICPNLLGDCFGIVAQVSQTMPVRVLAWQHSDIAYDTRLLCHYEPMLARFIAVSDRIHARLGDALHGRSRDITNIPYGIEVPESLPTREPLAGRSLRLLYTGRIEHEQKRIGALVALADELQRRGIEARLTLLGDGPAADEIDHACQSRPSLRRLPPTGPQGVRSHLAQADAFILASRYEGLCISMLEALAQGCVPIVTRVESGAAQAITDGINGLLAPVGSNDTDEQVASTLADQIERLIQTDPARLARSAWQTARERFTLERHTQAVEDVLVQIAREPPRPWPATRPCAFSGTGSTASGSVPSTGPGLMRRLLAQLDNRTILLHGAGRHTIELAGVLADAPASIVAIVDDDPARVGHSLLGWPIIAPAQAGATGATDIVISSWMHQDAIWARRACYESQGLRVHRIYS